MDPNPYEPPQETSSEEKVPSLEEKGKPLNLRRGAKRKVGSFRQWLGQFGILVVLMIVGGAIGWPLGFMVEGATVGIGVFTALMIVRR